MDRAPETEVICKVFLLFVKKQKGVGKKCICLQIDIGGRWVSAIPTPVLAINTYVLSSWAKISQKFISLGPHTKKSPSYILLEMYVLWIVPM